MFQKIKNKAKEKYNNIVNKSDKKEEVQQPPHIELEEEPQRPQNLEVKQDAIILDNNNIPNTPVKKKEGALDIIKQKYQEASGYVQGKVSEAQQSVKTSFQKVDQSVTQTILKHKQNLNRWIAAKADQRLQKSLKKMEPKIIASVDKSVPSKCLKNFVNDALLNMWKDITDLIRFELKVNLQEPQIELSKQPDSVRWLKPWYALRNWILYALQPYNLDYGDQVRRFSFILLKVLQAIPYFGIQAFTFFIVYLAIDKTEEYQIVYFILDYKNMQFFTAGCLTAIIGYIQYFNCATLQPSEKIDQKYQENYCFDDGPGMQQNLIISLISYFSQIILIWLAFAQLHRTQSKAEFIMVGEHQTKGGRLKYFMIYDLICFIISFVTYLLFYHFYFISHNDLDPIELFYKSGALVYFAKVLYGILSLPFIIFIIPFFVRMFTTAIPTGYDEYGNVVPMISKMKINYQELPVEEEEIDIEEALNNKQ